MEARYFSTLVENGTMASRWSNTVQFPSVRPSIVHTPCRGTDSEVPTLKRKKHCDASGDDDEDASIDGYPSMKRFVSEEDMANHLQQLQLTTRTSPSPVADNSVQDVDRMGVSHYTAEAAYYQCPHPPVPTSMDFDQPWNHPCGNVRRQRMVCGEGLDFLERRCAPSDREVDLPTYLPPINGMDQGTTRPNSLNSRRKRHCQTTPNVSIRLIPPTPTPTTTTSCIKPSSNNDAQEVLLEDVSEDSSDNGSSPTVCEVWLAPEIKQVIRESQDDILPSQILQELNKPCMQLVPYINPDLHLKQTASEFAAHHSSSNDYEKTVDSGLHREASHLAKDGYIGSCKSAVRSSRESASTVCLENEFDDDDDDDMEL